MPDVSGLSGIVRDLNDIVLVQLLSALVLAVALLVAAQTLLPWIASKQSGRRRLYLLATLPALRLLIIAGLLTYSIPTIIEPTFENVVALLGAFGLAAAFAFKDYISSLIAGVVTLYEMPYRPGDWIEIDGVYGEVRSIGMRTVEIVTPDDAVVVIPHLKAWDRSIHNANKDGRNLMCVASFFLNPHHDAEQIKHALQDVALTSPYLQIRRPIAVIVQETPWATSYRLKAYPIDPRQQFAFITDLTVRGKAALIAKGVTFATAAAAVAADA